MSTPIPLWPLPIQSAGEPLNNALRRVHDNLAAITRQLNEGLTFVPIAGGTMTGPLVTVASASGAAGLNIPHGTAPSSPNNGDVWTTTAGLFARINGATVQYGPGKLVKRSRTTVATSTSSTTNIPFDDTTPTVTEGAEAMSLSFTPDNNANTIVIRAGGWCYAEGGLAVFTLFSGSTCIDAVAVGESGADMACQWGLEASTTLSGATTISVRYGDTASNVVRLNSDSGGRKFGGVSHCWLEVAEYAA
jgi:hypothetical protein